MPSTIIPDVVIEQTVHALVASASACDAARLMTERNVSVVSMRDLQHTASRRIVAL